jgi:hypothetical protein
MHRTLVILGFLLATTAGVCQSAKKPLSDAALDNVTAAGVSATLSQGVVNFSGEVPTKNGLVTSTGTLAVQTAPAGSTNLSSLTLSGNAQQNLSSLININAVNSKINVLLNLNININSTVGQIAQSNLNGKH